MIRILFLWLLSLLPALAAVPSGARPNILFILVDDYGIKDVGTDFYPTILQLAGLPLRPDQHVDGVSLVPLLKGGQIPAQPLFWHYPHYGNQGGEPSSIIRQGNWKLIHYSEDGRDENHEIHEIHQGNNSHDSHKREPPSRFMRTDVDKLRHRPGNVVREFCLLNSRAKGNCSSRWNVTVPACMRVNIDILPLRLPAPIVQRN
jgi:hypothetical protein